MQVQVVGEGPPLALVGGGLTGWLSWEPHAERLSATRTVARLQLVSVQYGLENRPLPEGYSTGVESAALAAALDSIGWREPLDVVAWSYGAHILLDFALNNPERIRSLTLIESPSAWVVPGYGLDDPDVQEVRSLAMSGDVSENDLERFLHAAGLIPPGVVPQEMPQWPVWVEHRRSLRSTAAPLDHHDDPARLLAFDRPVLLVTGTGTTPWLRRIHDTLGELFPRARATEMPGGHAPQLVSMDRFLAELAEFYQSVGSPIKSASPNGGAP